MEEIKKVKKEGKSEASKMNGCAFFQQVTFLGSTVDITSVVPYFIEFLLVLVTGSLNSFLVGSRRFESSRFAEVYSAQEDEQNGSYEMQAG